jgi:type II secretory pathway pseudopilin PulG
MTILKTQPVKKSRSRLTYVFSTAAHDGSGQRVLAAGGINLELQHGDSPIQNPAMLEKQFQLGSIHARNAHREHEAQSTIISFAPSEFDGSNLATQSRQALMLVKGFIAETIPIGQTAIAVQADGVGTEKVGSGHRVHVHVITNRIDPKTGKALRNGFNVFKMRHQLDDYMTKHFEEVTGRPWVNPNAKQSAPAARADVPSTIPWRESLKQSIRDAAAKSETLSGLKQLLKTAGITMKPRGAHLSYTDADGHRARDFYQRKDRKTGAVISTRGLGQDFTPDGLLKMMSKNKTKEVDVNATIESTEQSIEQQRSEQLAQQQRQEQLRLEQQRRQQREQQQLDDDTDATTEPSGSVASPRPDRGRARSEPDDLER